MRRHQRAAPVGCVVEAVIGADDGVILHPAAAERGAAMRAEIARHARRRAGAVDDDVDVQQTRRDRLLATASERATGNHARDSTAQSLAWNEHSRGIAMRSCRSGTAAGEVVVIGRA